MHYLAENWNLSDRDAIDRHLAVNLFGPYAMTQAFLPHLVRSQGSIVDVVSLSAFAAVPVLPAYSISKAAAFSLSHLRTPLDSAHFDGGHGALLRRLSHL